jgi:hypothetical protein
MGILDKGPETVRVFPSVQTLDGYGNPRRGPGTAYVDVEGVFALPASVPTRSASRFTEDMAQGEVAFRGYTLVGRGLEICDPWGEIEWPVDSGQRWDVKGYPAVQRYPPKLAHASVRIESRGE